MKLIEIVPFELKSPATTGKWERGLTSISRGKVEPALFMENIIKYVNYLINKSKAVKQQVYFEEKKASENVPDKDKPVCPKCNNANILENTKAFYCANCRTGCKFTILKDSLKGFDINVEMNLIREILNNQLYKFKKDEKEYTVILNPDNASLKVF